jgi:transcription elongation factor Elf1
MQPAAIHERNESPRRVVSLVESATSCPFCGEHVSVSELLYETSMTENVSVAS